MGLSFLNKTAVGGALLVLAIPLAAERYKTTIVFEKGDETVAGMFDDGANFGKLRYSTDLKTPDREWQTFDLNRVKKIEFVPLSNSEVSTITRLPLATSTVKATVTLEATTLMGVYVVMGLSQWALERPQGELTGSFQDRKLHTLGVFRPVKTVTFH